jgi:uncharacterized protein (DUF1330 family)
LRRRSEGIVAVRIIPRWYHATREGWCFQHVQATIVTLGNCEFFLNRRQSVGPCRGACCSWRCRAPVRTSSADKVGNATTAAKNPMNFPFAVRTHLKGNPALIEGRPSFFDLITQTGESAMKSSYKIALALFAGVALGGLAIEGLHAQAKALVYVVTEVDVTNPDLYAKEYAPKVQAIIKAAGGRFLAIGGAGAANGGKVTAFEGDSPKRVVVQVWDSMDKIKAWRTNPEYLALRKVGEKYAKFRTYAVDGVSE